MPRRYLIPAVLAVCGLICIGPVHAGAAEQEVDKSPAFTIVGARVFDGERWLPPGTQVRVQHGLVLAVGPDVGLPRGGAVVDATGKTLLPEQFAAHPVSNDPQLSYEEKLRSGHGAIIAGAHADLRLVDSCGQAAGGKQWSPGEIPGEIIASWKNGVLVGHHGHPKIL